jgi:hypothetical protein
MLEGISKGAWRFANLAGEILAKRGQKWNGVHRGASECIGVHHLFLVCFFQGAGAIGRGLRVLAHGHGAGGHYLGVSRPIWEYLGVSRLFGSFFLWSLRPATMLERQGFAGKTGVATT